MPLFGRKKKKGSKELPPIEEAGKLVEQLEKEEEKKKKVEEAKKELPKIEEGKRPGFAPLFVRLNRYKQILNTMNYLKGNLNVVKNGLTVLRELYQMIEQNLKSVEEAVEKMEQKVLKLDSEFMRPSGFVEYGPEAQDIEAVEVTLADLKNQLDRLKAEIEQMT